MRLRLIVLWLNLNDELLKDLTKNGNSLTLLEWNNFIIIIREIYINLYHDSMENYTKGQLRDILRYELLL